MDSLPSSFTSLYHGVIFFVCLCVCAFGYNQLSIQHSALIILSYTRYRYMNWANPIGLFIFDYSTELLSKYAN